ncbi:amino acid--[acyl-carrier-protein] ligase [Phenylobacterium aquaticum]|uniref:amino acid--[acyl-carrier-protein] ligase n=1 Tax=Phenylobacterium aquaticum TaxID=1763816 RepID=UPI0026F2CFFF|nr:amino acid--[acyl-carrier-protein] ligase [Phenylobacterium aquaticum]
MSETPSLLRRLIDAGLFIDTGAPGLYGRSGAFEEVIDRIDAAFVRAAGDDVTEVVRFPPGMNRRVFETSGYLKSFPQLAGTVHAFCGAHSDHMDLLEHLAAGEDWMGKQEPTEVVLTPAACYPLYPVVAARGPLAETGGLFDLQSYCFRHEPSDDPARMQMFRMHEMVRLGDQDQVLAFRAQWLERGQALVTSLELPFSLDLANDPFFGRGGKLMAAGQRAQQLKFELLVPIHSEEHPTACFSFNYHQDHFGLTWDIKTAAGEVAHTACVGIGLERVAIALFNQHGLSSSAWPVGVRKALWG